MNPSPIPCGGYALQCSLTGSAEFSPASRTLIVSTCHARTRMTSTFSAAMPPSSSSVPPAPHYSALPSPTPPVAASCATSALTSRPHVSLVPLACGDRRTYSILLYARAWVRKQHQNRHQPQHAEPAAVAVATTATCHAGSRSGNSAAAAAAAAAALPAPLPPPPASARTARGGGGTRRRR